MRRRRSGDETSCARVIGQAAQIGRAMLGRDDVDVHPSEGHRSSASARRNDAADIIPYRTRGNGDETQSVAVFGHVGKNVSTPGSCHYHIASQLRIASVKNMDFVCQIYYYKLRKKCF